MIYFKSIIFPTVDLPLALVFSLVPVIIRNLYFSNGSLTQAFLLNF